ncbi:MAG: carbohydrate kinase [Thiothrix litoralis]|jgi:fructokinase
MFVVCGEALFDVFVPEGVSQSAFAVPFAARAGGSPFNVAIGLRRLGQPVALLTGVSTDFLGDRLMAVLQAEQVSTDFIARKAAPTTLGFIQKNAVGVPNYAFYGEGAADRLLAPADIAFDDAEVTGIHMGSYSLVVAPTADTLLALARRQAGKCLLSLDPNIRLTVEPDVHQWRERITQLLPFMDVVKVSDEDLAALYPGIAPESIIADWLAVGVKLAALTRGSEGASLWSQQAQVTLPTPRVNVVDTVGAGDTFQASLLDSLLDLQANTADWVAALTASTLQRIGHKAVCAAAITCSRQGADLPSAKEVELALADYPEELLV